MSLPNPGLSALDRLERFGIRLGLDDTRLLLAGLGNPQRRFPSVLVAGTNGKGSTAALLAAMGSAAGYRTGLYTSPHLEAVEERLRIDGRTIRGERLGEILAEVLAASSRTLGAEPTYFEALTASAFLWFAQERVDLAVVEVGLGGRLDATNTVEPILSLITSISYDHREHLGNTLTEIAREKSGILRPGRPALASLDTPEAEAAVRAAAVGIGAELCLVHDLVGEVEVRAATWGGQRVCFSTPRRPYALELSLLGEHQGRNLAVAVLAAESLAGSGWSRLDATALARGAALCRWPGRLEVVDLPTGRRILLDAAHNPEGAAALGGFLAERGEPFDLLFGVLADKDAASMLARLTGGAGRVCLTAPPSPRAADPLALAALLPSEPLAATVIPDPGAALDAALSSGQETLVVCGSIYLLGEVRRRLHQRFGVPPPAAEISTGPLVEPPLERAGVAVG